jgi:uncharacterized membrane protein
MEKGRLEAFTDGVIAIVITIMVLEMKVPAGADLHALASSAPVLLAYALSFTNVAIFWNNHHHMLQVSEHVNGKVLWANMFLLFWLSLVPFVIRWMDDTHYASLPTASYGLILAMSAIGYIVLQQTLIACNGRESTLAGAVGDDLKGKISLGTYFAAIPLSFVHVWIAIALYVVVAMIWIAPDRRIERATGADTAR